MFSALSGFVRSRKILPRVIMGTIGTIGMLTAMKVMDAHAQDSVIDTMLIEASDELFGVMRYSFPQEYEAFSAELKVAVKTGGDIKNITFEHLMAIRVKYAPNIAQANDAALAALADSNIAVYSALLEEEGPEVCAQYATLGNPALAGTDFEMRHSDLMMMQVAAMFHAAKTGIETPANRELATDEEWAAVAEKSLKLGADADAYTAMANGEADPAVCPSLISLLKTFNRYSDHGTALVRAEFLTLISTAV